jgi:hypothetical protein
VTNLIVVPSTLGQLSVKEGVEKVARGAAIGLPGASALLKHSHVKVDHLHACIRGRQREQARTAEENAAQRAEGEAGYGTPPSPRR